MKTPEPVEYVQQQPDTAVDRVRLAADPVLVGITRWASYIVLFGAILLIFFFELGLKKIAGYSFILGYFSSQLNLIAQRLKF